MRQALTPEQRKYLETIRGAPLPGRPPAMQGAGGGSTWWCRLRTSLRRRWPLRRLLGLALLLFVPGVSGQSPVNRADGAGQVREGLHAETLPSSLDRLETRLSAISARLAFSTDALSDLMDRSLARNLEPPGLEGRVGGIERQLVELEGRLDRFDQQLALAREHLDNHFIVPAARAKGTPGLREPIDATDWRAIGLCVGGAGLAVIAVIAMLKRRSRSRSQPPQEPAEDRPESCSPPPRADEFAEALLNTIAQPAPLEITRRPTAPKRRPAQEVLEELALEAAVDVRPEIDLLRVGHYSHQGFVRERNEDRGMDFVINGRSCLVVADGMGGEPDGDRAARIAVYGATRRLIEIYGGAAPDGLDPETVAANSLSAAQREIRKVVGVQRSHLPEKGYRTTLLVAVVDGDALGFAFIGDGGGCIVRAETQQAESFVTPMKAQPGSNAIYGSLGPTLDGESRHGRARVSPGDLILLGTDGIFDRVRVNELARGVADALNEFKGDVRRAVKAIVRDLATQRDSRGCFICDDNLTLGAIALPGPAHVEKPAAKGGSPARAAAAV